MFELKLVAIIDIAGRYMSIASGVMATIAESIGMKNIIFMPIFGEVCEGLEFNRYTTFGRNN
ncbi:hypothetical protein GCM10009332_12710 [Shewanella gelidii]|uniref:Uncharacterized protein n=1 Tax=Shewanella gelidii TaxID=1642821 RepID=A0A917N848_9GAMM|nr:hypothetical protein GCM10009332_12710 [Shewanella gelidii]